MDTKNNSNMRRPVMVGIVAILLSFSGGTRLHAQAFDTKGTAVMGDFLNPLTVLDTTSPTPKTCTYDLLRFDMALGKVFARPFKDSLNVACVTTLVDITSQVFQPVPPSTSPIIAPAGFLSDGLIQVHNFRLQVPSLTGASKPSFSTFICCPTINFFVDFVPNANNTPVVLIATGTVTVDANVQFYAGGLPGGARSGFLRGSGGAGGPGGYRGGDGGNGGISPSAGSSGLGVGGGPGGSTASCHSSPPVGAKFLTTGAAVPVGTGSPVPAGNDLILGLRGGSGGGGGGGNSCDAGGGGGGGGGAVLIAASTSITVNGYISVEGHLNGCCGGAGGTGGTIRLVSATIAGTGNLEAENGCCSGIGSDSGIVRLEAFSIPFSGRTDGNVAAASAPGQILLPTSANQLAFLQFVTLDDTAHPGNTATAPSPSAFPFATSTQVLVGRTGSMASPDVTMPNPPGVVANTVTVTLAAGPNTASSPFPSGKTATLLVTPLDPAQGGAVTYTGAITCPAAPANCMATIPGVTLPLGFSSMSAFTVVNLSGTGALARSFPKEMEGEPIESVRLQSSGTETQYVLISKSGREFPYKPGAKM